MPIRAPASEEPAWSPATGARPARPRRRPSGRSRPAQSSGGTRAPATAAAPHSGRTPGPTRSPRSSTTRSPVAEQEQGLGGQHTTAHQHAAGREDQLVDDRAHGDQRRAAQHVERLQASEANQLEIRVPGPSQPQQRARPKGSRMQGTTTAFRHATELLVTPRRRGPALDGRRRTADLRRPRLEPSPVTSPDRPAHGIDRRRAWVSPSPAPWPSGSASGPPTASAPSSARWPTTSAPAAAARRRCSASPSSCSSGFGVVSGRLSDRYGPAVLLVAAALCMSAPASCSPRGSTRCGRASSPTGSAWASAPASTSRPASPWSAAGSTAPGPSGPACVSAGSGLGTLLLVNPRPAGSSKPTAGGPPTSCSRSSTVVLLVVSTIVERPPVPPPPPGGGRLPAAGRTDAFSLLFASALLMSVSLFVAFAFVVPFAEDEGLSAGAASLLVGIIGAASVPGASSCPCLTGRVGPLRLYKGCIVVQPIAYVVWLARAAGTGCSVVFAVILGVSYGGYVALGPTVAAGAVRGDRPGWPARPAVPRRGHRRTRRTAAGRRPGRRHLRPAPPHRRRFASPIAGAVVTLAIPARRPTRSRARPRRRRRRRRARRPAPERARQSMIRRAPRS